MRRVSLAVVLVVFLVSMAATAYAMEKPVVTIPKNGDALGPSFYVEGYMPYRAFIVVITDVIRSDTGEKLSSVPGIRHWTNDDGTFRFRCASPRVSIGQRETPLLYKVRVFEASRTHGNGPETVITCRLAD